MPRLTESRRRDRRQQIAAAALRCFAREGFADTSMADIIGESGLSAGSIYSHFSGKADLVRFVSAQVLDTRFEEIALHTRDGEAPAPGAVLREILGATSDRDLARVIVQIWGAVQQDPGLQQVLWERLGDIRSLAGTVLAPWARLQAGDGDHEAALSRAADAVVTVMQGYVARIALDPTVDRDELRETLAGALDHLGDAD